MKHNTYNANNWRSYAACIESDPDLFFPEGNQWQVETQIAIAKAICAECVVKEECLKFALHTKQEFGIWGGTSENERRKLRRRWLQIV